MASNDEKVVQTALEESGLQVSREAPRYIRRSLRRSMSQNMKEAPKQVESVTPNAMVREDAGVAAAAAGEAGAEPAT